jgi:hypothetical protein
MKTAFIPQVRVEPELRADLDSVRLPGETLTEFATSFASTFAHRSWCSSSAHASSAKKTSTDDDHPSHLSSYGPRTYLVRGAKWSATARASATHSSACAPGVSSCPKRTITTFCLGDT